ncbi:lipopolysaccharide biosynthesis protein [Halorubrum distributum]|uniref:Oligosaccharide flippase family protein n=1 Tax=Halorubrum distributum TaxID=29283 RepID=A0A6B1ID55_9EURY|nr:lipopolysaccharide biosynthesis protein [Halorubrum terrestre]MYL66713.1 oligosaccharide flippase family protein [Halorubrum terrestre]
MLDWLRVIYNRLTAGGSTEAQAVQSGVWVTSINVGDRLLQLLKVIILARLLSPEAFGLLGIALLTIAALQQFSNLGFDEALIQHEDENVDAYLNTAWIIKIIRGVVIAIIAFLAAPSLAAFFSEPQAKPIIQLLGFTPLILGVQNPAVMYFRKHLNFHREFMYQVGGRLIDLLVAVAIALVFQNAWALPAGIVAMNLAKAAISYEIHEYRPRVEFVLELGQEMFGFGKWMLASSILVFIAGQGDDAFVGWYFTATTLGFYQIAYRISNAPATEVTQVISEVAFPAFSKVQDDTERLREGYLRTLQLGTVISFPMAAGIAAVAPHFVQVAFGNEWGPMVPLIQLLAIWGGIRAFGASVGPIYKSIGRPDIEVKLQAVKVVIGAIGVFPAAKYFGVTGVISLIICISLLILPIHKYMISMILSADLRDLVKPAAYPLLGSVLMYIAVTQLSGSIPMNALGLISLITIGVIIYTAYIAIIDRLTGYGLRSLFRSVVGLI